MCVRDQETESERDRERVRVCEREESACMCVCVSERAGYIWSVIHETHCFAIMGVYHRLM